jgi:diketogulonate reductase-like aldo/keto reductase
VRKSNNEATTFPTSARRGLSRRDFLATAGAAALAGPGVVAAEGKPQLPRRAIPGTDLYLPVVGLGNSNAFREGDVATSTRMIATLNDYGGAYVDCSGESRFVVAEVVAKSGLADEIFMGTYFSGADDEAARAEARALLDITGKPMLDLMHGYPEDAEPNWSRFRAWKQEGLTRFIGIARHRSEYYDTMIRMMETGTVDCLQVNYSLLEPEAAERVLPVAQEHDVAVMINRPFINGRYFDIVRGHSLPEWAADFDCESWAEFSLKFILSHPAVNCVLTETANPRHLAENLGAGSGALPDEGQRRRMLALMREIAG